MLWGYNALVGYIDEAYIGNGRCVYQLSVYQLWRNALIRSFLVFNPCVLYFRLLKKFAVDQLKYFKKPVQNLLFSRYVSIRVN